MVAPWNIDRQGVLGQHTTCWKVLLFFIPFACLGQFKRQHTTHLSLGAASLPAGDDGRGGTERGRDLQRARTHGEPLVGLSFFVLLGLGFGVVFTKSFGVLMCLGLLASLMWHAAGLSYFASLYVSFYVDDLMIHDHPEALIISCFETVWEVPCKFPSPSY